MSIRLLDVNVLVSLLDSAHVHHVAAVTWFKRVAAVKGWATCPITENGFVRIVSHVSYPNMRLTPALAGESLARFKSNFSAYRFWADDISLADTAFFDLTALAGSGQTTDAYLVGLAHRNGGRLATFDGSVAWRAVRGAKADVVDRIGG